MRIETGQVRCAKRGLHYDLVMMGNLISGCGIRALDVVYERWYQNSSTTKFGSDHVLGLEN